MPEPSSVEHLPFDHKDIVNIHGYFASQQNKTDVGRDIMNRCEELLHRRLSELNPTEITSGNIHCTHTGVHN